MGIGKSSPPTNTAARYEITGIDKTYVEWSSLFVMMLLTEIFAAGVKLQEEQDLTI